MDGENALEKGNSNEVGELDDLDELSEEQIEAIRANIGDKPAPPMSKRRSMTKRRPGRQFGDETCWTRATRLGQTTSGSPRP